MAAEATPRRSVSRVRVRYAETDQMGVVYHANYFVWFEVGRTDWLREAGLTYRQLEADGLFLPVTEAHCKFKASARYDDDLEIHTTAALVSPVRVGFEYILTGAAGVLATGSTVHATLDRQGRAIRVPDRIKALLA